VNDTLTLSDTALHQLGWRMAVLPFHCMGDTAGHALGLGMAEEISGALSRFCAARLISTATFWNGGKPARDANRRCRTYGLDYVVKGTMEVAGNDVRVTVDLLDVVLDFEPIWSRCFDGHLDNLFSLQRRIASETVAQLDGETLEAEAFKEPAFPTEIAAAHHAVLQAIQAISHPNQPSFMQARGLLERAIELDPDYAAAYAWLAYWCIMAVGQGLVGSPRDVTATAGAAAERAIALDPRDARALTTAGHVKAYLFHDVKAALAMHEQAVKMNPNLPIVWTLSAWSKLYNGEHETAIQHAATAKHLSPDDPFLPFTEHALATALLFRRQLEDAEALSQSILERFPRHASALYVHLAILGHLGRRADSRYWLKVLQDTDPKASVERVASRVPLRPDDKAFYSEGLRRAGLPERAAD
jgi:TolB-like protein